MEWFLSLIMIAVGGVCWYAAQSRDKRMTEARQEVSQNSEALRAIEALNKQYKLQNVRDIELKCVCSSRREYDSFDARVFVLDAINEDVDRYRRLVTRAKRGQKRAEEYATGVRAIKLTNWDTQEKKDIESQMFGKLIQSAITDPCIYVTKRYSTPSGSKNYSKTQKFKFNEIEGLIDEAVQLRHNKEYRQERIRRERERMTNSMRYDVLRRDGFKCVLCGVSADDGARLEVDHIVPVSKGGKTEMSNLRTLCDRCNSGKSDKIE